MRHLEFLVAFFLSTALFFSTKVDAQSRKTKPKTDTTFEFMSAYHCQISADSSIYKNERLYPEDYYYSVHKIKGRYYLNKETYHNDYSTADGNGHKHKFKPVLIDSFPPLEQSWTQIILIKGEKIKPFITYRTDSAGNKSEHEISVSHDCILKIAFNINGDKVENEIPTFPLEKVNVTDLPDRNVHFTEVNVNYTYNQSLKSVKTIVYVQALIQRLESDKKFILLK